MPPIVETPRLVLRNWRDDDRDLFREINRDPKVMEFFPFRRSAEEADAMMERIRAVIDETGFGFYAVELKESAEPIGFCGLARAGISPILPEDTVEIGWRLATRFWGNGYVTEAARALIDFGFATKGLDEIVSFAVEANTRSTAVMQRLRMRHDADGDFDHPRVPDTHPHLKRHVLYRIGRPEV
ncbi:MAG: GNAT family N-acetyltransferase [Alphaproteobacteria bacterium]|nr:GNAT family N-acetyltransferase [Rhizobiaceae bacterium]MBU3963817.1 GNAT family N-acetyltransferase [Alphaproteobacteria bacterium]MBU4049888.1 GNAT family N-acetyltransferase [Alphaproteobacteria bacterium]MBU4090790.1 GNAT family N-acetyltransferase [Alphaproteobacteria bacterium]MBU4155195.1 GNAT family N-acetyltransferase [Alphaproteobacteria bacterium]